jgi:hypothetical protein
MTTLARLDPTRQIEARLRAALRRPDIVDMRAALEQCAVELNAIARTVGSRAFSNEWKPEFVAIDAKAKAQTAFDELILILSACIPEGRE